MQTATASGARILLITTYFRPDVGANAVIMSNLAHDLSEMGHNVTVIAGMPHYAGSETNRVPAARHEQHGRLVIHRVPVFVPQDRGRMVERLISYASFNMRALWRALRVPRHDVALIPSPPLTNGLVGGMLSLIRGTPFVYNVQDIWPDVLVRAGLRNRSVIAALKQMERRVYRDAAACTVLSDGFRRNLLEKGVSDSKIRIIPNFVDTEFVTPRARRNAFSAAHQLDDKFVVMFAGNVGFSQGLIHVVEAAEIMREQRDVVFLIVGNGGSKEILENAVRERRLENVRFLPYQPHDVVPEMYATADVQLVPLRHGFSMASVPSKVLTIMSSGRPVVASVDPHSEVWQLIEQSGAGLNVEPEDPRGLVNALITLKDNPEMRRRMGATGRSYVVEHHSRKVVTRAYGDFLHSLCGR